MYRFVIAFAYHLYSSANQDSKRLFHIGWRKRGRMNGHKEGNMYGNSPVQASILAHC